MSRPDGTPEAETMVYSAGPSTATPGSGPTWLRLRKIPEVEAMAYPASPDLSSHSEVLPFSRKTGDRAVVSTPTSTSDAPSWRANGA